MSSWDWKIKGWNHELFRQLRGETSTNFGNPERILDVILIEQLDVQDIVAGCRLLWFVWNTRIEQNGDFFQIGSMAPVIGLEGGDINWFSAKAHRIYIVYMFRNKNTI